MFVELKHATYRPSLGLMFVELKHATYRPSLGLMLVELKHAAYRPSLGLMFVELKHATYGQPSGLASLVTDLSWDSMWQAWVRHAVGIATWCDNQKIAHPLSYRILASM